MHLKRNYTGKRKEVLAKLKGDKMKPEYSEKKGEIRCFNVAFLGKCGEKTGEKKNLFTGWEEGDRGRLIAKGFVEGYADRGKGSAAERRAFRILVAFMALKE